MHRAPTHRTPTLLLAFSLALAICVRSSTATQDTAPETPAEGDAEEPAEERKGVLPAPDRREGEGEGPFERLIIRGVTMINGAGSPPMGPVDVVVEGNRIAAIESVGTPGLGFDEDDERPGDATREIDAAGWWLMPGIVDLHAHTGGVPKAPEAEYVYKLWLAHGITTVRGVPTGRLEWDLSERERSARNEIAAPRIVSYQRPGSGAEWKGRKVRTPEDAREWVRYAARKGVQGLKLGSYPPEIMAALLDEARNYSMGSTAHLGQMGVAQMNAIDAARLGLGGMTHFYGLFESLYRDADVQPWPYDMNYLDEQHRFGQVARQWNLIHPRGSEEWNALLDEFLALDFYINPTMTIYSAGRDVMRARNADWHEQYTLPSLREFYAPSREDHGSYWYDWTTADEVAWKKFYQVWMSFLSDYKNRGGKVTVGSDSGFIYQTYGFGTILELELLQEAGFHPLEVIRAATMHGAMELEKYRNWRGSAPVSGPSKQRRAARASPPRTRVSGFDQARSWIELHGRTSASDLRCASSRRRPVDQPCLEQEVGLARRDRIPQAAEPIEEVAGAQGFEPSEVEGIGERIARSTARR